jgi:hypothetical protein
MEIIKVKRLPRFVNIGENPRRIPKNSGWIGHRQWKGCIKYGFTSAGQGIIYSQPLEELKVGDYIAAFITGEGYVGVGKVINESIEIKNFLFNNLKLNQLKIEQKIIEDNFVTNQPVEELPYIRKTLFRNANNKQKSEYVIRVEWLKVVERPDAFWKKNFGLYASRRTQCSLENQPTTIEFIEDSFKVKFQLIK